MSLDEAVQASLQRNELVRQGDEQVLQARERVGQSKGAILPSLSLNAAHLIQPEPDDPIAREFSPGQQTTAFLNLSQPVFRGFREFAGLRQQKRLLESQEAQRKQAALRVYQEVATAYLNVLTLEQDLRNLEEQAEIYDQRVSELRSRTRRGESSSSEYLSSQSTQGAVLAELRLVRGQVRIARETLASLTGQGRDARLADPALAQARGVQALPRYLESMDRRSDIESAQAQALAADESVSFARGAHWPTVDAVANYYLVRPGFLKENKWDVEIRFSLPIFSGGVTQSRVREAASARSAIELELARLRRLADQEIRSLHESLSARLEQVTHLRRSAELANQNVSVSQGDYRRGLVRNIDVQLALSEYRSVKRSLDQARFGAQLDLIRLELASGIRAPQNPQEGQK